MKLANRRWRAALALAVVMAGLVAGHGSARIRVIGEPEPGKKDNKPPENPFSAILQPSEEATTLLLRANEGLERQDWKLTIDSLQRIIELPGEHVLTSDGRLYESARWHAHRRLASLPEAGLGAYRLMYDGEAAALLDQTRRDHDAQPLGTIIDKFLMTSFGDDAAVTLADWLIDEGRFSEASALLERVRAVYPDSDLPAWVIPSRQVVCAAAMGQRQRARTMLEALLKHAAATRPAPQSRLEQPPGARSPGTAASTMPADRVQQITAYLDRLGNRPGASGAERGDETAAVEPAFLNDLPWHASLPVSASREQVNAVKTYARRCQTPPVRQLVTDGRVLVVKGERKLLALDVESFAPVWTSQMRVDEGVFTRPQEGPQIIVFPSPGKKQQPEEDPLVRGLLYDYVGGGVGLAFDMALTIEWLGEPPDVEVAQLKQPRGPGARFSGATASAVCPNRVAAYSLNDGSLVWTSSTAGEAGPGQEPGGAGEIEFLAVPIAVDGHLLSPCRVNNDLYAAVLDPKTGKLLRRVYLCGAGSGPFDSFSALVPCVADGVAFIPTGRGMLLALEVSSWSVRWAVRYEPVDGDTGELGWLPTPVVAVADVVLLAPADVNELLCLDRGTGEVRWRCPREGSTYLLGATDSHVWTAGGNVQMIEIDTGRPLWKKVCGEPTGRGVITGDRIYLPTTGGIVALNALTGETIKIDQPLEPPALGNLLAWDGALYSVSLFEMGKFPDLKRGYAEAVERHAADPANPSRSIRLAWLELLKDEPGKALAALAGVPNTLEEKDPRVYAQVNHLRVRSMLELAASSLADGGLAGSGQRTPAETLTLLENARAIAKAPEDAVQAAMALGDHHRRQRRPLEACLQYLSLVLSEQGDQMSSPESGFERRARCIAADRIAEAAGDLSETQAKTFETRLGDWLNQAVENHDDKRLSWVVESTALGDASCKVALVLGTWAGRDLQFERAESLLAQVLRLAKSPALVVEASARLAAIYLEPGELHLPASAVALLDRLERELGAVMLPSDVLDIPAAPTQQTNPARAKSPVPATAVAAALRKRVDADALARHQAATGRIRLEAPREPTVTAQPEARPLSIPGPRTEPLADTLLTLTDSRQLRARTVSEDTELWRAELRLLGEPAVEAGSATAALPPGVRLSSAEYPRRARGVAQGQTLIVNTAQGLHAVGLRTGLRLWSRDFEPPVPPYQDSSASDVWIWAHDGLLTSVNARGELEASRINEGARVLWRRSLPDRQWYAVRARGSCVVAVDAALEEVDVFGLSDGRYLGRCQFTQDVSPTARVNLTLYDEVICGPVSPKEVVALELSAPGAERWRISMPDKVSQLFKPTAESLAVADGSGHLQIIDPQNGKNLLTTTVYACEQGVTDGVVVDGVLYVAGYQKGPGQADRSGDPHWALAAIQMRDGAILWQKPDIPARAYLSADVLQASSNAIPVAVFVPADLVEGKGSGGAVELTVLDRATGEVIGEKITTPLPKEPGADRILDVAVWPGQVVVTTASRCLRFPIGVSEPRPSGSRPGS